MNIAFLYTQKKGCGFGHTKRCEILAEKLLGNGFNTFHITKDYLKEVKEIEPEIVVIDILGVKYDFVRKIKALSFKPIVVVIVTSNRFQNFCAHIVLNPFATLPNKIWEKNGKTFITGSNYNILDPAFEEAHKKRKTIRKDVKNILVLCGGEDFHNIASMVARNLIGLKGKKVVIVVGKKYNKYLPSLPNNFTVKKNLPNLINEMMWCDMAIATGGTTAYELCCVGVPSIIIPKDELEKKNMTVFAKNSTILMSTSDTLQAAIKRMCRDRKLRASLSRAGKEFLKPLGTGALIMKLEEKICERII